LCVEPAQAATQVNGIISQGTVWTKADSPYNLTGNVLVNTGAILTIEPGVTVNLNEYYIQVNGTLTARGTSAENIVFNGGYGSYIQFHASNKDNIVQNCTINCELDADTSVTIEQNNICAMIGVDGGSPIIHKNTINGWIAVLAGSPIISGNTIIGREVTGIIHSTFGSSVICDNTFLGSFPEAIGISHGSPLIERNLISSNLTGSSEDDSIGVGISISEGCAPVIKQNTITKCGTGISVLVSSVRELTVENNNFVDNFDFDFHTLSNTDFDVSNNWWGTTDTSVIDQKIWDFNDDFSLGKINYTPFLTQPNPQALPDPQAPIPTPITIAPALPSNSASPTPSDSGNISQIPIEWIAVIAVLAVTVALIVVVWRKRKSKKISADN
jgi:hypothetical protein